MIFWEGEHALLLPPGPSFVEALFGIWRAGGVAVPLAAVQAPPELAHILAVASPEATVVDASAAGNLDQLVAIPGTVGLGRRIDAARLSAHAESQSQASGAEVAPDLAPDSPALMLFTSGPPENRRASACHTRGWRRRRIRSPRRGAGARTTASCTRCPSITRMGWWSRCREDGHSGGRHVGAASAALQLVGPQDAGISRPVGRTLIRGIPTEIGAAKRKRRRCFLRRAPPCVARIARMAATTRHRSQRLTAPGHRRHSFRVAPASDNFEADSDGCAPAIGLRDAELRLEALAREARAGEREGARHLFEAIAPVVRRVCRGVLGHRHIDLEDTVQECLVDVVRALPQYRSEGHVLHYVTKIALRRALLARRRGAQRLRSLRVLEVLQGSDVPELWSGSAAEQSRMVGEVIGRVSGIQRETLVLRVVLGFSIEEVASIMSVPVNTVKARLRLAKNTLRRVLEKRRAT